MRFSPFAASQQLDLTTLRATDLGDVHDPDGKRGEERVSESAAAAHARSALLIAVGGDNSITFPLMRGVAGGALQGWGLITLDAHHDLRDGTSNGSPVRRLLEAGLPGAHVVQVGVADFANSAAYAARAQESGITVIARDELRRIDVAVVVARALAVAGEGGRPVYVDLDVDVCDRAEAPACPASTPGGICADDLRQIAFLLTSDPRVAAIDIAEIDATADAPDQRTVRLGALLVLEAAAGLAMRRARA
jgi:formiminoglutamase